MEVVDCDVLVLGAGGAGMRAAIAAAESGAEVAVASKSLPGKAHTAMAEGGFGAALGNADPGDSWEAHFRDTYGEGRRIGDPRMVERLVKGAPEALRELEGWGCLFDRDDEGRVRQRAFGGHTYHRACHFGDKTGLEMLRTLQYRAMETDAELLDETLFLELLTRDGAVSGAAGVRLRTGEPVAVRCGAAVLATGGYGRAFSVTSNSWETTGDGVAMAHRAGAALRDMEMVQFHPTGMLWPKSVKGKLVTEAVRGEGGRLLNAEGERFMGRYAPDAMELASRDVVSRGIYRELEAGRGTERGGVYLDVTHLDQGEIESRLPGMVELFETYQGRDIAEEAMEVAPTAHYAMGGVRVDPETCATDVPGLYAAGEAASGAHGANRLGTNSLPETLVFGRIAGEAAARRAERTRRRGIDGEAAEAAVQGFLSPLERDAGENPFDLSRELGEAMWRHMGIARDAEGMRTGLEKVREVASRLGDVAVQGSARYSQGLVEAASLRNLVEICEAVVRSALYREESRGAHYRTDFPETDPAWQANVVVLGGEVSRELAPELPERLKRAMEVEP